jgi:hypothetical protein
MSTVQNAELKALKDRQAALLKELEDIKSQFPTLKLTTNKKVQIGAAGTINFYGLGKRPVCLYLSQLIALKEMINNPELSKFIQDNMSKVAVKVKEE